MALTASFHPSSAVLRSASREGTGRRSWLRTGAEQLQLGQRWFQPSARLCSEPQSGQGRGGRPRFAQPLESSPQHRGPTVLRGLSGPHVLAGLSINNQAGRGTPPPPHPPPPQPVPGAVAPPSRAPSSGGSGACPGAGTTDRVGLFNGLGGIQALEDGRVQDRGAGASCQSSSTNRRRLHPDQGLPSMTDGPQAGGSGVGTLSGATQGGYEPPTHPGPAFPLFPARSLSVHWACHPGH